MALIGYARVSTMDQSLEPQLDALRAAKCSVIFEEHASGGDRQRPQLAAALARVRKGDTLVVARIDRLARSLSHLLEVVEGLRQRGAHFKSLADPIDTSGPSGVLVLQMLGAVAEFERSLIRERTLAGLRVARDQGRVGGNPGIKRRDPDALARIRASVHATRLSKLVAGMDSWMPIVRRLRPVTPWPKVAEAVNAALPAERPAFRTERLISAVQLLVDEGLAEKTLLGRAPRSSPRKGAFNRQRTRDVVAALVAGRPDITLREIAAELTRLGHRPARGGSTWALSTVKTLLDAARRNVAP